MVLAYCLPLVAASVALDVVVPEYERGVDRVLVSVPASLARDTEGLRNELFWLYRELHGALPPYSEMLVAVLPEDRSQVLTLLREQSTSRRTTVHVLESGASDLDHWAQDLGEPLRVEGEPRFLVSMPVEGAGESNRALSLHRIAAARQLFGERVVEADFVFEGGNLAFDLRDSGPIVLVGYNDVELTVGALASSGTTLTREDVLARMARRFGGARVVIMGVETQSPYLRHLDQAFVLLGDGLAVANVLEGDGLPAEKRQLERYRAQLEGLGYRVELLTNAPSDIRSYWNSVNAVPFTDRATGERRIVFPVFPGEVEPGYDGALNGDKLVGKARRAFELYRSLGYDPLPVRDFAFVAGGNTHCIANVLE